MPRSRNTNFYFDLVWFSQDFKTFCGSVWIFIYVVNSQCVRSLMRATEVGVLLAWSRSRRQLFNYKELVIRVPVSLCLLVFLMPFTRTAISGVDGEIDSKYRRCCGMPLNTSSKCWTEAACICVDCENRTEDISYGMEFCSSFPLNGILKNRTICQEWQSISLLQKKDKEAERNYNNFEGILQRIDCGENWETYTYSTASTCRGCLVSNLNAQIYIMSF